MYEFKNVIKLRKFEKNLILIKSPWKTKIENFHFLTHAFCDQSRNIGPIKDFSGRNPLPSVKIQTRRPMPTSQNVYQEMDAVSSQLVTVNSDQNNFYRALEHHIFRNYLQVRPILGLQSILNGPISETLKITV